MTRTQVQLLREILFRMEMLEQTVWRTRYKIMSVISEFADRQNTFNDRQEAAIAAVVADVQGLTELITALQASAGQVTPEDQAFLDQIESRASAITAKLDALDAMTPPVVPNA